jgi:3-oxoisoapionate kinase
MRAARPLPPGLVLAYYGDDFTGSTDAMEVLTFAGLPTILFLGPPSEAQIERLSGFRAVGIAGVARSKPPEWMDEHLPPMFETLAGLGAPILQYKVCSTFDSSPSTGSIGRAVEIGLRVTGGTCCAMLVAAPRLRRYQAFGNLFAAVDGVGHRLDRHPTMARHPVTPMGEADLRRHLAAQTDRPVRLIDFVELKGPATADDLARRLSQPGVVLFDVLDEETLERAGAVVWAAASEGLFAAASSGLQYALVAHWRRVGLIAGSAAVADAGPVERLLVASGSCSPATSKQIDAAVEAGFVALPLSAVGAADPAGRRAEVDRVLGLATAALETGRDVVVHAARGPDDIRIGELRDAARRAGVDFAAAQRAVAETLGDILARTLSRTDLRRCVVAGGDTSGHATADLGVEALEAVMPLDPGSPLCRAHRADPRRGPLELVLKGGQVGAPDLFLRVKQGRASPAPI